MKTSTTYDNDIPRIINNSLADNISWAKEQVNDALRYLTTRYFWNETSTTLTTVQGQQFYNLPGNIDKFINITITIGNVLWQPQECSSRRLWDALNVIQFQQEFPYYYYIYGNQVGIWPTPTNSTDTITINYKHRIIDLSIDDITNSTTGNTITVTNGTTTLVATTSGTTNSFFHWMAGNASIRIPFANSSASGDNQWYPIASVTSGTTAFLANPYSGATAAGCGFTIGQIPLLMETYQDLPLYRMGYTYYTTRFPDGAKSELYSKLWEDGIKELDKQFTDKSTNVVLSNDQMPLVNPNLYINNLTQS